VVFLLGALVMGLVAAKKHPLLFLSMACFFGFSFIISNIPLPQETIYAERNYYTPSLALSLLIAWAASTLSGAAWRRLLWAGTLSWVAAAGVIDVVRMEQWQTNLSLFEHDAATQPRSIRILENAGSEFDRAVPSRTPEYLEMMARQLEVEPAYPRALVVLATEALAKGEYDRAQEYLDRCKDSELLRVVNYREHGSRMHFTQGLLHRQRGASQSARESFEASIAIDPKFLGPRQMLVRQLLGQGERALAIRALEEAESRAPGDGVLAMLRGKVLLAQNEFADAERLFRATLPRLQQAGEAVFLDDWLDLVEAVIAQGRRGEGIEILEANTPNPIPPELEDRVRRLRDGR
jgi:tetratricopeptide (TPR) repeat protein